MESQSLNSITCSKSFTFSSLLPAFSILLIYPVKYSSELTQRYSSYIVLDNKLLPCECSFITPLFIVAPTGKQPKYPSHSTWAGKLVHPYRELLLSKERDKLPTHAATGGPQRHYAERKNKSQSQTITYYTTPCI